VHISKINNIKNNRKDESRGEKQEKNKKDKEKEAAIDEPIIILYIELGRNGVNSVIARDREETLYLLELKNIKVNLRVELWRVPLIESTG